MKTKMLILMAALLWISPAMAETSKNCEMAKFLLSRLDQKTPPVARVEAELGHLGVMAPDFIGFEDEVLRYFQLAPPFRRLGEDLAGPLGIHSWYARGLVLYYNLDDMLSMTEGEGLRLASRFRKQVFLRRNLERLRFYYRNVAHRSVAEMAQELGIAQLQVYNQLFIFNISIEDQWRKSSGNKPSLLDIGLRLRAQGVPQADILKTLEVSEDAWTSILHYIGVEPRGEAWSEIEVQRLVSLYQSVPVFDISLNFGRTEASISAKAAELGLRHPVTRGIRDVEIAPYGKIKHDGVFQAKPLEAFLWDHADHSTTELSAILGCSPTTLDRWKLRLGIFTRRLSLRARPSDPSAIAQLRDRYAQQEALVAKIIDHFANGGKMFNQKEFKQLFGIQRDKAAGVGDFGIGDPLQHRRIFDSSEDMWLAVIRGIEARIAALEQKKASMPLNDQETLSVTRLQAFSIFDASFKHGEVKNSQTLHRLYDQYRTKAQTKLVNLMVDHLSVSDKIPNSETSLELLGIHYSKATGTGDYKPGGIQRHSRIFDSPEDMWLAVVRGIETRIAALEQKQVSIPLNDSETLALAQLQSFSIFPVIIRFGTKGPSDAWQQRFDQDRPKEQVKLVNKIVDYLTTGAEIPNLQDVFALFGINHNKVTGMDPYLKGKRLGHQRIFDSSQEMWLGVIQGIDTRIAAFENKKASMSLDDQETLSLTRLQAFSIFDIPRLDMHRKPLEAGILSALLQRFDQDRPKEQIKSVNKIVDYLATGAKIPKAVNFKELTDVNYALATGYESSHRRIFDSPQALWQAVYDSAQARGLPQATLEQIQKKIEATSDREPQSPRKRLQHPQKSSKKPSSKLRK